MHETSFGKRPYHLAAVLCLLSVAGTLLSGCGSKSADTTAPGTPSAADAKMGSDYGKGVAAMHSQQPAAGAGAVPSHQ
jgi:hypothetical protein